MKHRKPPFLAIFVLVLSMLACNFLVPSNPEAEYGVAFVWTDRMGEEHNRVWIDPVVDVWELEFSKFSLPEVPLTGDKISVAFAGNARGNVAVLLFYFPCGEDGIAKTCGFTAQLDDSGNPTSYEVSVETDTTTVNQTDTGMFIQDGNYTDLVVPLDCFKHDETSTDGLTHVILAVCRTDDTHPLPGLAPQYQEPKPNQEESAHEMDFTYHNAGVVAFLQRGS